MRNRSFDLNFLISKGVENLIREIDSIVTDDKKYSFGTENTRPKDSSAENNSGNKDSDSSNSGSCCGMKCGMSDSCCAEENIDKYSSSDNDSSYISPLRDYELVIPVSKGSVFDAPYERSCNIIVGENGNDIRATVSVHQRNDEGRELYSNKVEEYINFSHDDAFIIPESIGTSVHEDESEDVVTVFFTVVKNGKKDTGSSKDGIHITFR